ncbi:Hpt domain-containing protein [Catenovulum sediminis]|uniref:Hpt domain-containing protein n=1 Tax=Catenovulum sediminis TaxID=1740262 RepID=A0ABV1RJS9_9ALTE|nr:Hpt domain-containing protein [Catenovulum sediminis]
MVINKPEALERLAGNEQLFVMLVKKFANQYENAASELETLLKENNLKDAAVMAHSIKGAAGNLSMNNLYEEAKVLEAELRNGEYKAESFAKFSTALNDVIHESKSW